MSMDRRAFLGAAGLSALAMTGTQSLEALAGAGRPETTPEGRRAPRWGMVIDLRKCLEDRGRPDCIAACERSHNVPRLESRRGQVVPEAPRTALIAAAVPLVADINTLRGSL